MYRTVVLAVAIAALSIPAFAGDITISLAGKTKAQVLAEIHHAAATVCFEKGDTQMPGYSACTSEVEQQALADYAAAEKRAKST
jgi:hypothetical protein